MEDLIDSKTLSLLKKCQDLPSPPGIADQIIHLSSDSNSDINTLADIVSYDPALSAKILRMANSAYYARRTKTENIRQAIGMFGWEGTLNLALSFSIIGKSDENTNGLDYSYFWKRSLASAVASRCLGSVIGYKNKEELFLPGLLQDIGMLAIDKVYENFYDGISEQQKNHKHLINFEKDKLGFDHAVVGAWLLSKWSIPEKITELVLTSHSSYIERIQEDHLKHSKCIAFAGTLADCICCVDTEHGYLEEADIAEKEFGIDIIDFMNLIGEISKEFLETANLFDVEIDDPDLLETVAEMVKMTIEMSGKSSDQAA